MRTTVVDHPLAAVRLTALREQDTPNPEFRRALHDLSLFVIYEALRSAPTATLTVMTPLAPTQGARLEAVPMIVPVLRAGLGMLDAALALIPEADVGFVGLKRNEETLAPDPYVTTVPPLAGRPVLVIDPMLATGGSLVHTLDLLADCEAGPITVACVLAAPEGIQRVEKSGHDVDVYCAAVDDHLNEIGYIVPGLGDAGDRQYGTPPA
ncbi:MAG: uracil phosphoribosyltransferase [Acidimicrobiales bacterium]